MRALISVYDKTGLIEFAGQLTKLGWSIVSSGGTCTALREAGIEVTAVEDVTGAPEMLGGRVKTLHPRIHGAILADLDKEEHRKDIGDLGIEPFDLVVCNLYPFDAQPSIEMIDVGGPTMVRAAAKNHAHVGVVTNPDDYEVVLTELKEAKALSSDTRRRLARKAFDHTASYDSAIVSWMDDEVIGNGELPESINLNLVREQELRYGENPHQTGARYREAGQLGWWDSMTQHSGMALSYLNLFDADAAWRLVHEISEGPAAVIVKHANPCGVALDSSIGSAYRRAFDADPVSAFGGIIALNRPIDEALAQEMVANPKADVLIAPEYDKAALELFASKRKNLRVLEAAPPNAKRYELRRIDGGFLVQTPDPVTIDHDKWTVPTKAKPEQRDWSDIDLAWRVCAAVSSNAIVFVNHGEAVGIGAGQQNRLDSAAIAARKAGDRAKGGVAASDAFFPFRDGLDAIAASGVTTIVQPGGSMRDAEVVAAADEHGIAMIFTGERHFKH